MKNLGSFDFAAIPSLNKTRVLELAGSDYATRRENIIAVGNFGTGQTHIGFRLGLAACQKGLSVYRRGVWTPIGAGVNLPARAKSGS